MDHSCKSVFKCSQPHVASVLLGSLITNNLCCKWKMEFLLRLSLLSFLSFVAFTSALLWILIFQKTIFDQYNPSAVPSDFLILN